MFDFNNIVLTGFLSWIRISHFFGQFHFKLCNFILKLSYHCIFRVFIYFRFVFYILCPRSVTQWWQSFIKIIICWPNIGNHNRFRITPQAVLQKSSEFTIPIRHMPWLIIHQSRDNVSQGGQWLIDINSLLKPIPLGLSFTLSLTPSQIYQIKLPHPDFILPFNHLWDLYRHREQRMRPTTVPIHSCLSHMSILAALLKSLFKVRRRLNHEVT